MTTLRGIAWDHPRGYEPLRATSAAFEKMHPGVVILWDVRSLKEFGDMPIEDLIDQYDLITIDHPYMGQADANKLLLPLEERLSCNALEELKNQSVGPSFDSYHYNEHLYALPIDAAALVSASRSDLLSAINMSLPTTRKALLQFYKDLPKEFSVAWPLCATDLWCSFLSLCAQDGGRDFLEAGKVPEEIGSSVLDEIKEHLNYLHPQSIHWNPIHVLDRMGQEDQIIYAPYLFGYTNYSREGYSKNRLSFGNSPGNPETNISTILGGVGLAISANCKHISEAVAYLKYTANSKTQEGIYTKNGGQPGNLVAWHSETNNALCDDFFEATLSTMEKAYVRPQHRGWNQFQEQGAEILHRGIVKDEPSTEVLKDLNELYQSII